MRVAIYPEGMNIFAPFYVKSFKHTDDDLSKREKKSLERNGTRLWALAHGTLAPQTEDEKHFLKVVVGSAKPRKVYERAWLKYHLLKKEEEEIKKAKHKQDSPKYKEYLRSRFQG